MGSEQSTAGNSCSLRLCCRRIPSNKCRSSHSREWKPILLPSCSLALVIRISRAARGKGKQELTVEKPADTTFSKWPRSSWPVRGHRDVTCPCMMRRTGPFTSWHSSPQIHNPAEVMGKWTTQIQGRSPKHPVSTLQKCQSHGQHGKTRGG